MYGCTHYRRRCKLVAPCCGEVFWCRHCHNEKMQASEWVRKPDPFRLLSEDLTRHISLCSNSQIQISHGYSGMQDPAKRHELSRKDVKEVVCAICDLKQPISDFCSGCQTSFGAWACLKCNFFDDDLSKKQFHCDLCGICRVGGRENFFHCEKCGCCYSQSLSVGLTSTRNWRLKPQYAKL